MRVKSDYDPKHKYKIIKFENGLGKVWYKIQIQGWIFNRWFNRWYDSAYGWTPCPPIFDSEEEARRFLSKEEQIYKENELRKIIKTTEIQV